MSTRSSPEVGPASSKLNLWSKPSPDALVVPAGLAALADYSSFNAYFCQPGRSFRPTSHIAFYSDNQIHPVVPAIDEAVESLVCSEESIRKLHNVSPASRSRLLSLMHLLRKARSSRIGQPQGIMLLSPPSDPRTIHLRRPVANVQTSKIGRRVAFTQGTRYVSLEALKRSPATTADLLRPDSR